TNPAINAMTPKMLAATSVTCGAWPGRALFAKARLWRPDNLGLVEVRPTGEQSKYRASESASSRPRAPFDELSCSFAPDEVPVFDDDLAARDDRLRHALHRAALVGVVVHLHVQCVDRQQLWSLRVEDDDVGVRAGCNRALARQHAEDLRGARRCQLDPAVQ